MKSGDPGIRRVYEWDCIIALEKPKKQTSLVVVCNNVVHAGLWLKEENAKNSAAGFSGFS